MKKLYPIMLVLFTNILGAGVILPVLPLYAEGTFHGTITQITLLASAFFGAQFLSAPWLGRLSDRYGRRPVLLISQLGTVVAFIIFIFAEKLGLAIDGWGLGLPISGGMLMLFAGRILDGITGGNITTAQAYAADITSDEERARGLGLLQAAFGAGFVFGPALGGLLGHYGRLMPFVGATIITVATLLLTYFTLEESLPPSERTSAVKSAEPAGLPLRTLLRHRPLLLVLAIGFISSLAFSAFPSTFSLYADHVIFPNSEPGRVSLFIGLFLGFLGLMQVVTQLVFIKPLVARFGERRLLAIGDVALSLAFFLMSAIPLPLMVGAMMGLFAFGIGVTEPSMQAIATRFGNLRTRGHLLGVYQAARSLALIFGPILAGWAYDHIGPRSVFNGGGWLMALTFIGSLLLIRMEIKPIVASELQPSAAEA
jgi:DHA1 family tetracycline resistance protein-like MFS transporter